MAQAGKVKEVEKPLDGRRARDSEVIEAAVDLFWEKGYASTSVQDVADALGMLKGSLYYYIKSKEDLLKKIFEDSHAEVREITESVLALEQPSIDRLRIFIERYAGWYLLNLRRAALYTREWRHASPELRKVMASQRQYYNRVVMSLIDDAKEAGATDKSLDTRLAAYFIMSAVSSLPDWYRYTNVADAQNVAAGYADLAMRTLAGHG
jgi:TetR/AcrR family transcriptional regulator, cholesterol catabolism regulator